MRNEEHCRATRILLGISPNKKIHRHMHAYAKKMRSGHRQKRHDYHAVESMEKRYGKGRGLEAALHIACEMGLVTNADVNLWEKLLKATLNDGHGGGLR